MSTKALVTLKDTSTGVQITGNIPVQIKDGNNLVLSVVPQSTDGKSTQRPVTVTVSNGKPGESLIVSIGSDSLSKPSFPMGTEPPPPITKMPEPEPIKKPETKFEIDNMVTITSEGSPRMIGKVIRKVERGKAIYLNVILAKGKQTEIKVEADGSHEILKGKMPVGVKVRASTEKEINTFKDDVKAHAKQKAIQAHIKFMDSAQAPANKKALADKLKPEPEPRLVLDGVNTHEASTDPSASISVSGADNTATSTDPPKPDVTVNHGLTGEPDRPLTPTGKEAEFRPIKGSGPTVFSRSSGLTGRGGISGLTADN